MEQHAHEISTEIKIPEGFHLDADTPVFIHIVEVSPDGTEREILVQETTRGENHG